MKRLAGPAVLLVALSVALAADAQPLPPAPSPTATPAPGAPIVPGSLSGSSAATPAAGAVNAPSPTPSAAPAAAATPVPGPSIAPPSRFHLHRPGTDVDGDLLSGNAASDIYVFRGNVTLRSDPKIDRAFGSSTESDDPITVTADEIDIDRAGLTYVAKGHVHFVQGDRSGRADIGMLNEQTHDLDLVGNADVLDGDHRARAAKMHYNLADRQFHGAGDVRIYEPLPTPNPSAPKATAPPKRHRRLPL